ncbi:hypothetical protein SRHO_G00124870 [Serrasalmus rhombeus]
MLRFISVGPSLLSVASRDHSVPASFTHRSTFDGGSMHSGAEDPSTGSNGKDESFSLVARGTLSHEGTQSAIWGRITKSLCPTGRGETE